MIWAFLIIFTMPKEVLADIFVKSASQTEWNQALEKDPRSFYYRGGFDYNAFAQPQDPYQLRKDDVFLGYGRYNAYESLKNFMTRPQLSSADLEVLMNQLSTSRFLVWQYSSPTLADFYKHLDTLGHLQLSLRYQQFEDLERAIQDPLMKLRKQSVMDCLKDSIQGYADDIDLAFQNCLDRIGPQTNPYQSLEDPGNGSFHISGAVNVTDKALDRINTQREDLTIVKNIVPNIMVSQDSVSIRGPIQQSRQLVFQYRGEFLVKLQDLVKSYKDDKTIDPQNLAELSVFGVPLTEGQIRNLCLLDETTGYLAIGKIASQLAYLKAIDQYTLASSMLERTLAHPAIGPAYKTLLKQNFDFIQKELLVLAQEKERLSQYADTMHFILDEADRQRLKASDLIRKEIVNEQQKGLWKLNP